MNNWIEDLKIGAAEGFVWVLACSLLSLAFGLGFYPGFLGFVMMTIFSTWIARRERQRRELREINDLMTALRISMTGK